MKRFLLIFSIFLTAVAANAQDRLKGSIVEAGSNTKLSNVFIHNTTNKQIALADKDGKFDIRASVGHVIIFDSPGYKSDTLYLADMRQVRVELIALGINLNTVNITASRRSDFDPQKEYPEIYTKSKVYVMSPSTWFSKEGKDARRLKKYFAMDAQERHVDDVYTAAYVGSIVPLKGQDLANFMVLYRPTYAFLRSNTGPSLVAYINDSYKKYNALPPEKRIPQSLTGQPVAGN